MILVLDLFLFVSRLDIPLGFEFPTNDRPKVPRCPSRILDGKIYTRIYKSLKTYNQLLKLSSILVMSFIEIVRQFLNSQVFFLLLLLRIL